MAIDNSAKRQSAMFVECCWRGAYVQVDLPFAQRHRQAAAYMYSGILAQSSGGGGGSGITPVQRLSVSSPLTLRGGL